jgi:hypothetical protein
LVTGIGWSLLSDKTGATSLVRTGWTRKNYFELVTPLVNVCCCARLQTERDEYAIAESLHLNFFKAGAAKGRLPRFQIGGRDADIEAVAALERFIFVQCGIGQNSHARPLRIAAQTYSRDSLYLVQLRCGGNKCQAEE